MLWRSASRTNNQRGVKDARTKPAGALSAGTAFATRSSTPPPRAGRGRAGRALEGLFWRMSPKTCVIRAARFAGADLAAPLPTSPCWPPELNSRHAPADRSALILAGAARWLPMLSPRACLNCSRPTEPRRCCRLHNRPAKKWWPPHSHAGQRCAARIPVPSTACSRLLRAPAAGSYQAWQILGTQTNTRPSAPVQTVQRG